MNKLMILTLVMMILGNTVPASASHDEADRFNENPISQKFQKMTNAELWDSLNNYYGHHFNHWKEKGESFLNKLREKNGRWAITNEEMLNAMDTFLTRAEEQGEKVLPEALREVRVPITEKKLENKDFVRLEKEWQKLRGELAKTFELKPSTSLTKVLIPFLYGKSEAEGKREKGEDIYDKIKRYQEIYSQLNPKDAKEKQGWEKVASEAFEKLSKLKPRDFQSVNKRIFDEFIAPTNKYLTMPNPDNSDEYKVFLPPSTEYSNGILEKIKSTLEKNEKNTAGWKLTPEQEEMLKKINEQRKERQEKKEEPLWKTEDFKQKMNQKVTALKNQSKFSSIEEQNEEDE